jgi:hypothetical protein
VPVPTVPPPLDRDELALERFAPVVIQEVGHARFDTPMPLDPDGSGLLADDAGALDHVSAPAVPFYATLRAKDERLFLFYALYYPLDWSGDPRAPRADHVGDLEGALVVVSRKSLRVEAVATQAHGRFYLWAPAAGPIPPGASGTFAVPPGERPVLFSEAGGHGLYAFGHGRWLPKGGNRYPEGTAGVRPERLVWIQIGAPASAHTRAAELRPLSDLLAFTQGERGGFRGLPRGARPPWLWDDKGRRELPAGLILDDPARLVDLLSR